MVVEQRKWTKIAGWQTLKEQTFTASPQIVFVFGAHDVLRDNDYYEQVRAFYPESNILACSTGGEIFNDEVNDNSISLLAVYFEKTTLRFASTTISGDSRESFRVAKDLSGQLPADGLTHVMVFSDGLAVNGSGLIEGLSEGLPQKVSVTGGFVADAGEFTETSIGLNGPVSSNVIVLVGFYGESLHIGYGSLGGWDNFGPERLITKSQNNVLYELDYKPVLALYREYLGDQAANLPGSGLFFPINLRFKNGKGEDIEVVRSLRNVDEATQSITFFGDVPEGSYARLMKANFDRLVDGAFNAAKMSIEALGDEKPELAILISCIGRKAVLKERIEEEVEAAHSILGGQAAIAGFYSFGEICPVSPSKKQCQFHNKTMTITTFREI